MSRTPARITQADVARVIRAAQQCGAGLVRILRDGTVSIMHDDDQQDAPIVAFDPFFHPGYVYFIGGGPFIKIGWSASMEDRIAALQTGNPYKLEILGTCVGSMETEREFHEQFKEHRAEGEWFADCTEIRAFIEIMAQQL